MLLVAVLVASVALPATSQHRVCPGTTCEPEGDFHFQLLQYSVATRNTQDQPDWIGKNGNPIRSGATSAIPPATLSAGPTWTWTAPNNGVVRGSPIVDKKGNIYQTSVDGDIMKFARDGQQVWKLNANTSLPTNPGLMGSALYVLGADGSVLALSTDGAVLWKQKACDQSSSDTHTIMAGSGVVIGSCMNNGEEAPFGSSTKVFALDATNGDHLWTYVPDQRMYNFIGSIQHGSVLFSDLWGGPYRLNLTDGSVIWKTQAPSTSSMSTGGLAGASNGLVYVSSNREEPAGSGKRGIFSAYTYTDGTLVWRRYFDYGANSGPAISLESSPPFVALPLGSNPGLAVPGGMAVDLDPHYPAGGSTSKPSKIIAMDPSDGHTIWEHEFPVWEAVAAAGDTPEHNCLPDSYANPAIAGDGSVYVAGMSGKIHRLHDANGDGKIDTETAEYSEFDTGNAFQAAPGLGQGILAIAPCNGLQVFIS